MLLLAVVAPLISPVEQRGEVLIVTVLFGLAGTLMLYTSVDSGGARAAVGAPSPQQASRSVRGGEAARVRLKGRQARLDRTRALAGLIFGLLFGLAGAVAPFVLSEGEANPDARFLMVIGFSPVVISGALMVMVFGRMLQSTAAGAAEVFHGAVTPTEEAKVESIGATLAKVGVFSGVGLTACAIILPFIVRGSSSAGIAAPAAIIGGVGIALSLISGWFVRRKSLVNAHAVHTGVSAGSPRTRRTPVPRIPSSILYRVIAPAAILLLFVLIVVIILTVVAATVTPLVH